MPNQYPWPAPEISDHDQPGRRAYLVGIAGAGMRSLAQVLLGWGWQVAGSDRLGDPAGHLTAAGIRVHRDHRAEHLSPKTDLVVYSDALPAGTAELHRARELGIPAKSYFETLGGFTASRHALAVAGTHGKSTVTAMAARLLIDAGLDPTVVCGAVPIGGVSTGQTGGGRAGSSRTMLVEACEYRAHFLHLFPRHAVILGIEPDHFDCYKSLDELEHAFGRFVRKVPPDGLVLARHDCPTTRRVTAGLSCRVETFGFDPEADWSAQDVVEQQNPQVEQQNPRVAPVLEPVWLCHKRSRVAPASHLGIAIGGHLPSGPLLSQPAELATEGHGGPFDDAVVRRFEKDTLVDLFGDIDFRQFPQKFLFPLLLGLPCGVHAWVPSVKGFAIPLQSPQFTKKSAILLLTFPQAKIPRKS